MVKSDWRVAGWIFILLGIFFLGAALFALLSGRAPTSLAVTCLVLGVLLLPIGLLLRRRIREGD